LIFKIADIGFVILELILIFYESSLSRILKRILN